MNISNELIVPPQIPLPNGKLWVGRVKYLSWDGKKVRVIMKFDEEQYWHKNED